MLSTTKSDALTRIAVAIETHQQRIDYPRAEATFIDAYLKKNLSDQDWLLWQELSSDEQEVYLYSQDYVPDEVLSLQQVRLLLKQYKRAGYEFIQFGHQTPE